MTGDDDTANCFLCRKHRGELPIPGGFIYKEALLAVCHVQSLESDSGSTYPGYVMIENKRHVPGLAGLTSDEARAGGLMASRLARVLIACEGAKHIYDFVFGHDGA